MKQLKIYVASSFRNPLQKSVVEYIRDKLGHDVYDFRNPESRISWSDIDEDYQGWSLDQYRGVFFPTRHPVADRAFSTDMAALRACDACLMVTPCGDSSHLELGFARGAGKRAAVLILEECSLELMYGMLDDILLSLDDIEPWLQRCRKCGECECTCSPPDAHNRLTAREHQLFLLLVELALSRRTYEVITDYAWIGKKTQRESFRAQKTFVSLIDKGCLQVRSRDLRVYYMRDAAMHHLRLNSPEKYTELI